MTTPNIDTAITDMTVVASTTTTEPDKTFTQADVDRIVAERVKRAKPADYDDMKARARRADELEAQHATESEKAVKAARDEARAEALREAAPRMVGAEFRAAAKGVLTTEQTAALLEDLDLSKYLTDKGEVNVEKVEAKIKAFAPAVTDDKGKSKFPDLHQGRRERNTMTGAERGRAEAEKRFGKKQ